MPLNSGGKSSIALLIIIISLIIVLTYVSSQYLRNIEETKYEVTSCNSSIIVDFAYYVRDFLLGKIKFEEFLEKRSQETMWVVIEVTDIYRLALDVPEPLKQYGYTPYLVNGVVFKAHVVENVYGAEDLVNKEILIISPYMTYNLKTGKICYFDYFIPIYLDKTYVLSINKMEEPYIRITYILEKDNRTYTSIIKHKVNETLYDMDPLNVFLYKDDSIYYLFSPEVPNIDQDYENLYKTYDVPSLGLYKGQEPFVLGPTELEQLKQTLIRLYSK